MTFWEIFVRVFPRRPVAALAGLWWHLTGRRLRARNFLRAAGARLSFAYDFWQRKIEAQSDLHARNDEKVAPFAWEPKFFILPIVDNDIAGEAVTSSIASFERQTYPNFVVQMPDPDETSEVASLLEKTIRQTDADFLVPVGAGTQLSPSALLHFVRALQSHSTAVIIYGDQDEIDGNGKRTNPWFKPSWNEELFLAQDYMSSSVAINVKAARGVLDRTRLTGGEGLYELLLRLAKGSVSSVIHVPHIITHVRNATRRVEQGERVQVVAKLLEPLGAKAHMGPFGTVRVSWPLPVERPLVSIIIPTKDKVELLSACVDTLLQKTNYKPFEILIVDNASVEKPTLDYLGQISRDERVRVLPYRERYNFSAINNYAARQASGEYLCLLNNDTEIVDAEWLTELMRYAVRPDIGAAGAKLLYADGRIQHAGVIVGIGDAAGHPHRNQPASDEGYFALPHAARFVSAVTGACLVVDRRKFMAVGGLDEDRLAVAYNDVDLCLKLERAGWRNVYVPHAVLIHHESKSRGKDHSVSQIDRYRRELRAFQERWDTPNYLDPQFNPNLDRTSETFIIRL